MARFEATHHHVHALAHVALHDEDVVSLNVDGIAPGQDVEHFVLHAN
jgi:hypothetical protein